MKRVIVSLVVLLSIATAIAIAQTNTVNSVNVVGFHTINIVTNRSIIAIPMQKVPAYRGTVTANDGTVVADSNASWTASQFLEGVAGQEPTGNSTFYMQLVDMAWEGRHLYIADNTTTGLLIKGGLPADINPGDLVGAKYSIVAANRVRDLFGEPGDPILTGGTASTGDTIRKWDSVGNQWDTSIYHHSSGDPTSAIGHWRKGTDFAEDEVIDRDEAVLITRRGTIATNITAMGEVASHGQLVIVDGATRAFSGGMIPMDMTVEELALTNAVGFDGNYDDTIRMWDANLNQWGASIRYHASGDPTSLIGNWVQTNAIVNDLVIPAGTGYLYTHQGGTALEWPIPSPLN